MSKKILYEIEGKPPNTLVDLFKKFPNVSKFTVARLREKKKVNYDSARCVPIKQNLL